MRQVKAKKIDKKEIQEVIREIDESLLKFIKEGKYKDVLISMGNLSRYSFNNQIYIITQNQMATRVYGLKKWNSLGRHIKAGEKSIKIFSPILKKNEEPSENGDIKVSGKYVIRGFRIGHVFDISQTEGKEIDVFKFDETKTVGDKDKILEGLRKTVEELGYDIEYVREEELAEGCFGLCNHSTHKIKILQGLSDLQEISTTVHECGHALAHSAYREDFEGLTSNEKREVKEVEAESIACIVCTYLGLDTQNFNFSYISGWAEGDISKFRKNLDVVSKHATTLIEGIEKELYAERVADNAFLENVNNREFGLEIG